MKNYLEKISTYADPETGIQYDNIPDKVIELNKFQIQSMIASILHSSKSPYFKEIFKNIKQFKFLDKKLPLLIDNKDYDPELWAYLFSTLSMLFDYDDFMFAGHTGHSSVIIPFTFSKLFNIDGKEFLTTQTVGNELGGRMGATIFIGPQNGQLWTPVHHITAGAQIGRLKSLKAKLNNKRSLIANSITAALSTPTFGLWDVFFSSSAKIFTASNSLSIGIRSALLSGDKIYGSDPFKKDSYFYKYFSYMPLLSVWKDLNDVFYTETISFKKFPGCAYIAGPVEACEKIFNKMKIDKMKYESIKSIKISCNILSKKMDDLSRIYLKEDESTLTTLNFSLLFNCSIMLRDGSITMESFTNKSISDKNLWDTSKKIKIEHNTGYSFELFKYSSLIPNSLLLIIKNPFKMIPYLRKNSALAELIKLPVDIIKSIKLNMGRNKITIRTNSNSKLDNYHLLNGARVIVKCNSGKKYSEEVSLPSGFAGDSHESIEKILDDKLRTAVSKNEYNFLKKKINRFEELSSSEVIEIVKKIQSIIIKRHRDI